MKKAALHNLGCKVNAYETEAMKQLLIKDGYQIVPFSEVADVYIVNTCSVTNMADRKSRQMLHKARKINPNAVVVAVGCYAQTQTEKAMRDLSIDLIIGNNKKKEIVSIINEYFANKTDKDNVIDINKTDEYEDLEIETVTEHTRAHLKIQDGCNNFCSYCIIPYARGRIRSRKLEHIIKEIENIAQKGFQEVVLSGINLSCYKDGNNTLIDVIEKVSTISGIERIRLGSLDPDIVTEEFARRLSKVKKICPHFHLSLQSGCDKILKLMNRHYATKQYEDICNLLRKYFDGVAITTDIIVGFPKETEEDFEITKEFVKRIRFFRIHVFKYSKRDGTVAAKMDGQVPEQEKTIRSDELIRLGEILTEEYQNEKIGQSEEVLFEEQVMLEGQKYFVGHTKDYVKIAVVSGKNIAGEIRNVTIKDRLNHEIMLATL